MPIQKNKNESISITSMSLVEFLPLVVDALKEGYELDLESNEGYPQQLGTLLVLTMFKKVNKPIESGKVPEVVKEVPTVKDEALFTKNEQAPVQRGRPKLK